MTQCYKIYVAISWIARKHHSLFPCGGSALCGGIHMGILEKKLSFSSSAQLKQDEHRVGPRLVFCSDMQQQTTVMKTIRDMKWCGGLKESIIDVSKVVVVVGSQYLKNHIPLTRSSQGLKWFWFWNGENNYSMSGSTIAQRESWPKQAENGIKNYTHGTSTGKRRHSSVMRSAGCSGWCSPLQACILMVLFPYKLGST